MMVFSRSDSAIPPKFISVSTDFVHTITNPILPSQIRLSTHCREINSFRGSRFFISRQWSNCSFWDTNSGRSDFSISWELCDDNSLGILNKWTHSNHTMKQDYLTRQSFRHFSLVKFLIITAHRFWEAISRHLVHSTSMTVKTFQDPEIPS